MASSTLPVYSPNYREPPLATHIARSEPMAMPGSNHKCAVDRAHRLRIEAMEEEVDEILEKAGSGVVKVDGEIRRKRMMEARGEPRTVSPEKGFVELVPTLPESPQKAKYVQRSS